MELHKLLGIYVIGTVRSDQLSDLVMKSNTDLSKKGRHAMEHHIAEIDGVQVCAKKMIW